ncbi:uncharacterized protein LOC110931319 [Helianthus annuus]|uniref:uncharacterized protein LOC110931319 n=1 Tax=Helianthus annuus TaxID=4232 RepID=UPI000B8F8C73|nr:uncharacterized protein LOC110931319 [Helianthus annuus]
MSISVNSNNLTFVNDLNPGKDMWNMKARIIRKWNQRYKMDLIFIDEKGAKIQASIKSHLIPVFDGQLQEDVVILSKFGVGYVVCCGDLEIFDRPPKETKKINFDIQDLEGLVLRCTVWNDYALQFKEFISKIPPHEHVMVVIQHGKCKEWKCEYTVQSDRFATQIFLNEEIDEVNELRRAFFPLHKEFVTDGVKKHVDEISEIEKEMSCVVVAKIKIVQEEYGWFYLACRKCFKKVMGKSEYLQNVENVSDDIIRLPATSLVCPKCRSECSRCKSGESGSVSFVMFDRDVQKLLGLATSDIRERQVKANDTGCFPHEIFRLVDKKTAFKINVLEFNLKNDYHVYTVQKTCDDPVIIAELVGGDGNGAENIDEVTQEVAEVKDVNLSESSQVSSAERTSRLRPTLQPLKLKKILDQVPMEKWKADSSRC